MNGMPDLQERDMDDVIVLHLQPIRSVVVAQHLGLEHEGCCTSLHAWMLAIRFHRML
jgi:hypothetical protein